MIDDVEGNETPAELAALLPELVRFGPSSWTYPGWTGLVYHGEYPRKNAATLLLGEAARYPLFRTVGIDSAFYAPPSRDTLARYAEQLPEDFPCVSKVWQEITVHTWTRQDRKRAGQLNENFLNAQLFLDAVAGPYLESFAGHAGPLVLEFPAFGRKKGLTPEWFAEALDRFLEQLPRELQYAVELRSPEFLTPMYLEVLRTHGVAHTLNAWSNMPTVGQQLDLGTATTAGFIVCRALLRPGMLYGESVDAFAPFDRIRAPDPVLRMDLVRLMHTALELNTPAFVVINNRTEGCSPLTIAALARLWKAGSGKWEAGSGKK